MPIDTFDTTDLTPLPMTGAVDQEIITAVDLEQSIPAIDFCWCRLHCDSVQLRSAGNVNTALNTDINTDKDYFIFRKLIAGDTVAMTLWKDGVQVDTLNDQTYGFFADFGDMADPLLTRYDLEWDLVYAAFGVGQYVVKCSSVILSQTAVAFQSVTYNLQLWNERRFSNTVRISGKQNGYIESNIVDHTGMNLKFAVRLSGSFMNKQPTIVTDHYEDSDRNSRQIQDKIEYTWTFVADKMNMAEQDYLFEYMLLANEITLTSYNLADEDRWKPTRVKPKDIEKVEYNTNMPGSRAVLKFKAEKNNHLKRNVYF